MLFAGIMLPMLALCYYCGVLPSRAGIIRKSENFRQFNIGAVIYLIGFIAVAVMGF